MTDDLMWVRKLLTAADDFALAGHTNPDGDAIGSCLSLAMALTKMGKRVNVFLEKYSEKFNLIPGSRMIRREQAETAPAGAFICLDCGDAGRLGEAGKLMKRAGISVCVDHHISNTLFADRTYLDPGASSTCELIYRIIKPLVGIDAEIASALYAGVVWDTGGFRHGCTSGETMRMAADLIDLGVPFTDIHNGLLYRHSPTETAVFGEALNNVSYYAQNRVCCSCINHKNMKSLGASGQDVDNIAEYLLNVSGVGVSVFMYEKASGVVKASFRSKEADVSAIARGFGGGGHINAAGATIEGDLDQTRIAVLRELTKLYE